MPTAWDRAAEAALTGETWTQEPQLESNAYIVDNLHPRACGLGPLQQIIIVERIGALMQTKVRHWAKS